MKSRRAKTSPKTSRPLKSLNQNNTSIYTSNDAWTSEFILAAHDFMSLVNRNDSDKGSKWSRIDESVPFKIFDIPNEEFVVTQQLNPTRSASQRIPESSSQNQLRPITDRRKELSNVEDKTFLTSLPPENNIGDVPHEARVQEDTEKPSLPMIDISTNHTTRTYGGMSISAPKQLLSPAENSTSQQYLPSFCKRNKSMTWESVAQKPVFIVPNPLQKHPYLFRKEKVQERFLCQPAYTQGMEMPTQHAEQQLPSPADVFRINNQFRPSKRIYTSRDPSRGSQGFMASISPSRTELDSDDFYLGASSATLSSRSPSMNNIHSPHINKL